MFKFLKKSENESALMPEFSETITKEDVQLPEADKGKLAFLLHNILTKKECENLIKESEKTGFEPALVKTPSGRQVEMKDVRNSHRCIIDSFDYVNILWERVKDFIPPVFSDRNVVGLNERLRFLRYDPGEYFKPHLDGCTTKENGEKSFITFQLYLNESKKVIEEIGSVGEASEGMKALVPNFHGIQGFKGGATTFLGEENEIFPVIPKRGTVLIFQHNIRHEGSLLKKGRKYTVRTDIMYEPIKK